MFALNNSSHSIQKIAWASAQAIFIFHSFILSLLHPEFSFRSFPNNKRTLSCKGVHGHFLVFDVDGSAELTSC